MQKRNGSILAVLLFVAMLGLSGCEDGSVAHLPPTVIATNSAPPSSEYLALLAQFPEDQQGLSKDFRWPDAQEQPMTFGLVLSAESLRYRAAPTADGKTRILNAVEWLLSNSDADHDGLPGWGLPDEYDAFGDGSVNPANSVYTITTSIVMNGLLDALQIDSLWSSAERREIEQLLAQVAVRWCETVWTSTESGGYFWYSPEPDDDKFVANVSAMFLGTLARLRIEAGDGLDGTVQTLTSDRMDRAAQSIIASTSLRNGAPFWAYLPLPNFRNDDRPNDLVHHVYVVWGMELYRLAGGKISLPWTRSEALRSLDAFCKTGSIFQYPQDVVYQGDRAQFGTMPAELWGVGMMLAFYARWGDPAQVDRAFDAAKLSYGAFPLMHRWPPSYSSDSSFYARFAAHVLWGIAVRDFSAPRQ